MIHAARGTGKTFVGLGIAFAVASGSSYLTWTAPEPARVLLIDGEMPGKTLQDRLTGFVEAAEEGITDSFPLDIINPDLQDCCMPDLATKEGQRVIDEQISSDTKLVIVDNISSLVRSGRENDAESWMPVQEWALKLRQQGKAVLFIHHSNKSGHQRGASKREDVLDSVINLRRPSAYSPDQGACFEVHFEKARGMFGDDVKPFEARLQTDAEGRAVWTTKSLEDSTYDKVLKLKAEGLNQQEIAEELDIHKSTVSRHLKKARNRGELPDANV